MKKAFFISLVVTLTIVLSFFFLSELSIEEDTERASFPPFILINGTYYKQSGFRTENLPLESTYLGTILSSVPSIEMPTQSFQANDEIVGAAIYQSKTQLFVQINNAWWEYLEFVET